MLYQTCPRESQITCVFIRALDSGHKEWIVLTCRGGAALNITGYLAEVGLGRFTSDNRLNTTKYAQDIAQSLGRYLYDDDNAIRVYQA